MNDATNAPDNEPEKSTPSNDSNSEERTHSATGLPVKNRKSKKKLVVMLVLLLFVIVLGVVAYFLFTKYVTPNETKDETGYASATKFASANKLVEEVKPDMVGTVLEVTEAGGQGGKTSDGFGVYGVVSYKVGDRKYSNLPTESSGAGYLGDSKQASENYSTLTGFFKDNKFKQLTSGKDAGGPIRWLDNEVTYVNYATYESGNLLCMIWHADASGTALGTHVTSVGCADKSSYAKAAEALDPYFAAYTKGDAEPADKIVLGDIRTGDSNTAGYKVAVLYQEDPSQIDVQFDGLYYKAPGQNEWSFFLGSQGWIDCTDFNTDAVKKAFDGFNCYDKVSDTIINVGTGTLAPELKG